MKDLEFSPDEMMVITAARLLEHHDNCFVGIGLPSQAANLARLLYGQGLVLIYESGCIGAKPAYLPNSIADAELAITSDFLVSVPEMFQYWLQGGRINIGFLGAAQIDKFANINTTVIGDYNNPEIRLPGAGGAPEIAANCGEVVIMLQHRKRAFVDHLSFVTTTGHHKGGNSRKELGLKTAGPLHIVTDLGVLEPDSETRELVPLSVHPGATQEEMAANTGWVLSYNDRCETTPTPTERELTVLRSLRSSVPTERIS